MDKHVRDYAGIMYKDGATRRMLERYGDLEIETLDASTLTEIATYVTVSINRNPFAVTLCKRAQGDNFSGNISYKLYQRICKGFGIIVY